MGKPVWLFSLVCVLFLVAFFTKPTFALAEDPDVINDVPGQAITTGAYSGTLDQASDIDDVYRITLAPGKTLAVTMTGDVGTDFDLYLYAPGTTSVITDTYIADSCGVTSTESMMYTITTPGNYYIDVYGYDGSGSYTIEVAELPDTPNDIPGQTITTGSYSETLDEHDRDVYGIDLLAEQTITISMTGAAETDFDLAFFSPDATSVSTAEEIRSSTRAESYESITYTTAIPGTYYIGVFDFSGSGSYTINVDVSSGIDIPDDIPGHSITTGSYSGTVHEETDWDDIYAIDLLAGQAITISMTGRVGANIDLYLYPPGSTTIWIDDPIDWSNNPDCTESITYVVKTSGTYYIDVWAEWSHGDYNMNVNVYDTSAYYFPWYDCKGTNGMQNWLLVSNPHATNTASVQVQVNGVKQDSANIGPGKQTNFYFGGLQTGPVELFGTNGLDLIVSSRVHRYSSFNEVFATTKEDIVSADHTYYFPWYDCKGTNGMQNWLLVSNPHATETASVQVKVNGILRGSANIGPGKQTNFYFGGLQAGPVEVIGSQDLMVTSRVHYFSSFNEVFATTKEDIVSADHTYYFPWYDCKGTNGMQNWLLVSNPHATETASVQVKVNGILRGSANIGPGKQRSFDFAGLQAGPVEVICANGLDLIVSSRVHYYQSFNEFFATSKEQL